MWINSFSDDINIRNKTKLLRCDLITKIRVIVTFFKQKINWTIENNKTKSIYKLSKWISIEDMRVNWEDMRVNKLSKYLKSLDNHSIHNFSDEEEEIKYWYNF